MKDPIKQIYYELGQLPLVWALPRGMYDIFDQASYRQQAQNLKKILKKYYSSFFYNNLVLWESLQALQVFLEHAGDKGFMHALHAQPVLKALKSATRLALTKLPGTLSKFEAQIMISVLNINILSRGYSDPQMPNQILTSVENMSFLQQKRLYLDNKALYVNLQVCRQNIAPKEFSSSKQRHYCLDDILNDDILDTFVRDLKPDSPLSAKYDGLKYIYILCTTMARLFPKYSWEEALQKKPRNLEVNYRALQKCFKVLHQIGPIPSIKPLFFSYAASFIIYHINNESFVTQNGGQIELLKNLRSHISQYLQDNAHRQCVGTLYCYLEVCLVLAKAYLQYNQVFESKAIYEDLKKGFINHPYTAAYTKIYDKRLKQHGKDLETALNTYSIQTLRKEISMNQLTLDLQKIPLVFAMPKTMYREFDRKACMEALVNLQAVLNTHKEALVKQPALKACLDALFTLFAQSEAKGILAALKDPLVLEKLKPAYDFSQSHFKPETSWITKKVMLAIINLEILSAQKASGSSLTETIGNVLKPLSYEDIQALDVDCAVLSANVLCMRPESDLPPQQERTTILSSILKHNLLQKHTSEFLVRLSPKSSDSEKYDGLRYAYSICSIIYKFFPEAHWKTALAQDASAGLFYEALMTGLQIRNKVGPMPIPNNIISNNASIFLFEHSSRVFLKKYFPENNILEVAANLLKSNMNRDPSTLYLVAPIYLFEVYLKQGDLINASNLHTKLTQILKAHPWGASYTDKYQERITEQGQRLAAALKQQQQHMKLDEPKPEVEQTKPKSGQEATQEQPSSPRVAASAI